MVEFSKNELYEIEKILDDYAGRLAYNLNEFCKTNLRLELENSDKPNLNKIILDLHSSFNTIKEIRMKLERERLSK